MNAGIVSDINQWSAFFTELLKVHSAIRGSALNKTQKTQTWNISLINTATTPDKTGREFPYFQAVDKGRGPVTTRFSGYIVFAGHGGEVVTTQETSATTGYNITAQAIAKQSATFDAELHATMNSWLATHQEAAIRAGTLASGISLDPVPMVANGFKLTPKRAAKIEAARERAYTEVFNKLVNKSAAFFNAKDIIRRCEAAGDAAGLKEFNRFALGASAVASGRAFKSIKGAAQNNPAIQKLAKIPNWYALAGIFAKVTGDQVEKIWKPLTPSRKETGSFKLAYVGAGQTTVLDPSTGGSLIHGYKLVTNNELERLIGGIE